MPKHEKVCNVFVRDCLKFFALVFTSLKEPGNYKNGQFLVKAFHKYCPTATGTAFSTKFFLESNVQKKAF